MTSSGQSANRMRLLADIGGTNVRFALLPPESTQPQQEANLLCADFPGPEQAALHYLAGAGNIRHVLGVPDAAPHCNPARDPTQIHAVSRLSKSLAHWVP